MVDFCLLCQKKIDDNNWRHTKVQISETETKDGWVCSKHFKPKYVDHVPQYVKDDRRKYALDLVQSHRQGQMSREYVELYPDKVRGAVAEGAMTKEEVKSAKPVWAGDIPGLKGYKPKKKFESVVKEL